MSAASVLLRVELPLALPVIMAGIRTALVLLVGTATLATFINGGGLGATLQAGISLLRYPVIVWGAVLVALLALLIEWLGRVLELLSPAEGGLTMRRKPRILAVLVAIGRLRRSRAAACPRPVASCRRASWPGR